MMQRAMRIIQDETASPRKRLRAVRGMKVWLFFYRVHLIHEARRDGYSWREIRAAMKGPS